jgi:hypothetical protein
MTLYAHKNSIDVELMGDNNNWYKWLVLKPSKIPDAGNGLFTARAFLDGDVITKYLGNVTNRLEKAYMESLQDELKLHTQYNMKEN